MSIVFSILGMVICGLITNKINTNKGYDGGFAWGFFLGLIGIIIVVNRADSPTKKTEVKTVEENESEQKLITSSKSGEERLKDSSCKVEVKENMPAISSVISSRITETWEEDVLTVLDIKEKRPAISSVIAHLKRTKLFLEDEEWILAEEYCEKVLDEDPECGLAYFYKFMAKNRFSSPLKISTEYFIDEDRDIKKALRFASDELKKQISSIVYNQKKAVYDYGVKCFTEKNYEKAMAFFLQIEDFEDSKIQVEQCQNKIRERELQKQYNMAISFMGNGLYSDAIEIFTHISDFKDSSDRIKECETEIIKQEEENRSNLYKEASDAMQRLEFNKAISLFYKISDYNDSKDKIKECYLELAKLNYREEKRKAIQSTISLIIILIPVLIATVCYLFCGY